MSHLKQDFDYLIVGHGIAGLSIAWHLLDAGKTFKIVADSSLPSSTRVAAGICNPLTGKKLVKTWMADDLFPYAHTFYTGLEERLGIRFFYPTSIYRPYRSIEEQNTYLSQSAEERISTYIGEGADVPEMKSYVNMDYGALEVIKSAWVDLSLLLDSSQSYFEKSGHYIEANFDFHHLNLSDDLVTWQGIKFGKIILCQGFEAINSPVFDWLPFTPVKGQVLDVEIDTAVKPNIVNQGIFILPHTEHRLKVGATYSWDPLDWKVTQEATDELEDKLKALIKVPYQIKGAIAGIRPSVKDRRPLIGIHPTRKNVCLFNGLGTKGVTLGPYFANQLIQHLENNKELNSSVNIQRYFSLYFH